MSHKKLISLAFQKAEQEEVEKGNPRPSKSEKAGALSIAIVEGNGFNIGERSLRDYYNAANKAAPGNDFRIPQFEVVKALVEYLEFSSYQDFEKSLKKNDKIDGEKILEPYSNSSKSWFLIYGKHIVLSFLGLILISFIVMFVLNEKQRWMIWKSDHYEEINFSAALLKRGRLKLYDSENVEHFRKIKVNCDFVFFNPDGSEKFWYGKNSLGELEIFSSLELHPETGKTLKPITEYMIEKYICPRE